MHTRTAFVIEVSQSRRALQIKSELQPASNSSAYLTTLTTLECKHLMALTLLASDYASCTRTGGASGLARSEMTMIGFQLMLEGCVNTFHRIAIRHHIICEVTDYWL